MIGKITIALVVLGISCVLGQQELMRMAMLSKMFGGGGAGGAGGAGATMGTGLGGMDPLTTMALLKGGGGGGNKALSMIAMMNMLKPNPAPAAATNVMTDPAAASAVAAATSIGGAASGVNPAMTAPVMTAPVVDPMTNTLMQMSLCQRSEAAAESRICTPLTCKLQSLARHGNPNLLQCRPLLGCCFADMKSMVMANMLKSM